MKILVVGDFHGKSPKKIVKAIKSQKPDLILSVGDYIPMSYRKIWFKHSYAMEEPLWKFIGKTKYKKYILNDLATAEKLLKKLNSLGIPIITTLGNVDYPSPRDIIDYKESKEKDYWRWESLRDKQFIHGLKKYKNIKRADYKAVKFRDFVIIGGRGHSAPGRVRSKGYKKHKRILEKLFKKISKESACWIENV